MSDHNVVIVAATRTPIGAFQGVLAPVTGPQLGAVAARAAIAAAGIEASQIEETIFGCVLSAGLGQAPARQAAIGAGVPVATPATTLNKMCGSGLKAIMAAADQIRAGDIEIALAGGLESMTNAPYLLPKARGGYRMGHGELLDHMFFDGLQSPDGSQVRFHAHGAGRVRYRIRATRARGDRGRRLRKGNRAGDGEGPQGRDGRVPR
jgi:acetyl-CoA C-acetyltransferase